MPSVEEKTVIFLGPQGSGKGTQVQLLKNYFTTVDPKRSVLHYDSGAAMREFSLGKSYSQTMVRDSLALGHIQPDFLATTLFGTALTSHFTGHEHLIADGFPRTVAQAAIFETVADFYALKNKIVISLTLSDEMAIERMLKRGRDDDTEEAIRNRLSWYRGMVLPTIEYFVARPEYCVYEINGDQTMDEVHANIVSKMTQHDR